MKIKDFFESKEKLAIRTHKREQVIKLLKAFDGEVYYDTIKLNEKDNITLKVEDIIFEDNVIIDVLKKEIEELKKQNKELNFYNIVNSTEKNVMKLFQNIGMLK